MEKTASTRNQRVTKGDTSASRSQQQRRAETTRKLLEATIESVLDIGYAATTVRSVADRAGVSLGARSHFYPRRIDMVVAALDHLCDNRIAAARAAVDQVKGGDQERLRALLNLMWDSYADDNFVAGMKLWVAAADDPELHAHLATSTEKLTTQLMNLYAHALGEHLIQIPNIAPRIAMVHNLLTGHAFNHNFDPSQQALASLNWPQLRADLEQLILG